MTEMDRRPTGGQRTSSEAALVEHTRAAAEVAAAVQAARMVPRDLEVVRGRVRDVCQSLELAQRAFYAYSQGGENLQGPTVVLARQLAAIFGNVDYGTAELSRNADQSEVRAWAWEQETNTRVSRSVIIPHRRYVGRNGAVLTEMRAIDQNNNSVGGRAIREMIFGILPPALVEEAKRLLRDTLERGDGKPLAERIAEAIRSFGNGGVTPEQLERRVGRKSEEWTAQDVADLSVLFESLRSREITKEEAFPTREVSAEDLGGGGALPPEDEDPTLREEWGQR